MTTVGFGQLTLTDLNDAIISGVAPTNPSFGTLWIDSSQTPPVLKRWDGLQWVIQNLDVSELDPDLSETIEFITITIGNMANDNFIDFNERKTVKDKLTDILGSVITNSATEIPTSANVMTGAKGGYWKVRQSALNAGIPSNHATYTTVETRYNELRTYLNGLTASSSANRNLILNTNTSIIPAMIGHTADIQRLTTQIINGEEIRLTTTSISDPYYRILSGSANIQFRTKYTISGKVFIPSANGADLRIRVLQNVSGSWVNGSGGITLSGLPRNEWVEFERVVEWDGATATGAILSLDLIATAIGQNLTIKDLKLEVGSNATGYIPAFEDIKVWNTEQRASNVVFNVVKDTFRTNWLNYYLSVDALATYTAQVLKENVDNIVIGGTNYASNGDFSQLLENSLWKNFYVGQTRQIVDISTETPPHQFAYRVLNTSNVNGGIHSPVLWEGSIAENMLGREITISFWLKYQNITVSGSNTGRFGELIIEGETSTGIKVYSYPRVALLNGTDMTWKRYSETIAITLPTNAVKITRISFAHGTVIRAGEFWTTGIKIEIGNKVTDWSPSPFDLQERLTKAEFKLTDDAIISTVTSSQTFITQLNDRVGDLKVGSRNYVLNSAFVKDLRNWFPIESYINSEVQLFGDKTFKDVDDVGVFLGHLFQEVGDFSRNVSSEMFDKRKWMRIRGDSNSLYKGVYQEIGLDINKEYTISFRAYKKNTRENRLQILVGQEVVVDQLLTNQSTHYSFRFTSKSNVIVPFQIICSSDINYDMAITEIKIEEGVFATDWSPAPEDLYAEIDFVGDNVRGVNDNIIGMATRLGRAEQKVTDGAIISTVTSSTEWGTKADLADIFNKDEIGQMTTANLLKNPSWESDSSGWSMDAGWTYDVGTKYEGVGTHRVVVTGLASDTWRSLRSDFVNAVQGEDFVGSVFVRATDLATDTGDRGWSMEIEWLNASNTRISTVLASIKPSAINQWQRFNVVGTAPANTAKCRIRFQPNRNGSFWVAKPMLQRGNMLTAWIPSIDELAIDLKSQIVQSAGRIDLVVDAENKIKGTAIASAISLTPDAINLISNNINLTGKVTFESFNQSMKNQINVYEGWKQPNKTTINGGNIETGSISATSIKTNELIVGTNIAMGANATISWANVSSKPSIPSTASDVGAISSTYIDSNGVWTGFLNASRIISGTIDANTVNVTNLNANNITSGSISANRISGGTITADVSMTSAYLRTSSVNGNYIEVGNPSGVQPRIRFYGTNTHVIGTNGANLIMTTTAEGGNSGALYLRSGTRTYFDQGTVDFSGATSIIWGSNAPVAVFG